MAMKHFVWALDDAGVDRQIAVFWLHDRAVECVVAQPPERQAHIKRVIYDFVPQPENEEREEADGT